MANPLRVQRTLQDLADGRQLFDFEGKLVDFPRLAEVVSMDLARQPGATVPHAWEQSPVHVRLRFGWADQRETVPSLAISLFATLPARCQRCLELFDWRLESSANVHLVRESAGRATLDGVETWEVDSDTIRPLDIAEEALIMALPLAAMHEPPERCGPLVTVRDGEDDALSRPFAGLRSQMDEAN